MSAGLYACRTLALFLFCSHFFGVITGNLTNQTSMLGTTPSPFTECISVFRNTSVIFTNPRAGKLSGLTLRFISDVGFSRSSKIILKLPGFTRLDGSSGEQFMFTSGTTPGATGGSVSVGQAGDLSISFFTGAQWDDETQFLTLTQLSSPAVPPNLPVTVQISPEANLILPGLLADLQSGVALRRSAAAPGECAWSPVIRVQPIAYLVNTSIVLETSLPCAATSLNFTFTSTGASGHCRTADPQRALARDVLWGSAGQRRPLQVRTRGIQVSSRVRCQLSVLADRRFEALPRRMRPRRCQPEKLGPA
jgi:hypothetical protein